MQKGFRWWGGFSEVGKGNGKEMEKEKDSARLVNFKWHVNFLTLSWHFMSTMQPLLSATRNPRLLRHILATQPISLAVCVTCGKRCLAKCHHYVNYKCNRLRLGPKEGVWPVGGTKSQCMRLCGSYTSVSGAKAEVLKRCVFANSALSLIARHYLLFCRCVQLSGSDMSSLAASELLMYVNGVYWCTARYKFYGLSLDLRMSLALKFGHMTWHFQLISIKSAHKQPRWLASLPLL